MKIDSFTDILILTVILIFIGKFIVAYSDLFFEFIKVLKYFAIPLLIALLIYGLSVIWPSIQQFFSKIFEVFSGIPELFSKIPGLFSDIISWFTNKLTV